MLFSFFLLVAIVVLYTRLRRLDEQVDNLEQRNERLLARVLRIETDSGPTSRFDRGAPADAVDSSDQKLHQKEAEQATLGPDAAPSSPPDDKDERFVSPWEEAPARPETAAPEPGQISPDPRAEQLERLRKISAAQTTPDIAASDALRPKKPASEMVEALADAISKKGSEDEAPEREGRRAEERVRGADKSPPPDLESRIGSTWALRIGLVLLAIALAFFATNITPRLGPGMKVAMAYAGAMGLFALGKVFEERLRLFARPVMAGGLALGFFVSFAAHFIPATECIGLVASLTWMTASAMSVLAVAERWKSQLTAALSIFLGYVCAFVAAGDLDLFSLIIIVFLAATAIALLVRHQWAPLSLFAVVASYGSHLLWLVIEEREVADPATAFWMNFAFLSSYYLIFLAGSVLWTIRGPQGKGSSGSGSDSGDDSRAPEDSSSQASRSGPPVRGISETAAGRALGPANLVFYVAFVSWLYVATDVFLPAIHWFFLGLASVQVALSIYHLRGRGEEDGFYPTAAVVLATLGAFSAFDALSLNLVLASEALILLLAAHRTGLWVFHLLAQVALALNFAHYWIFSASAEHDTPWFIGSLVVVGVYGAKARLEELWYGGEEGATWRPLGHQTSLVAVLARTARTTFRVLSPWLAPLHAAAGAMILTYQCVKYLPINDATLFLAGAAVVVSIFGAWQRSPALLAGLLMLLLCAFVALGENLAPGRTMLFSPLASPTIANPWVAWALVLAAFASTLPALALRGGALPRPLRLTGTRLLNLGAVLVASGLMFAATWDPSSSAIVSGTSPPSPAPVVPFVLWLLPPVLLFFHHDRFMATFELRAAAHETPSPSASIPTQTFTALAVVSGLAGGTLLAVVSDARLGQVAAPLWVIHFAAILFVLAAVRRRAGFAVASLVLVGATHFYFLQVRPYDIPILWNSPAAVWIALVTLSLAWGADAMASRIEASSDSQARDGARVISGAIYAAGAWLLIRLVDFRIDFAWSSIILGAVPIAFFGTSLIAGPLLAGRWAARLMLIAVVVLHLIRLEEATSTGNLLTIGLSLGLAAFAVLLERLEARFPIVFPDGRPEVESSSVSVHAGLVILAAIAAGAGFYYSAGLEPWRVTAGWSLTAAVMMGLGFLWRAADYRRMALAIFAISLVRVFVVDARDLTDAEKAFVFLTLGLCFVGVGFLYNRFPDKLRLLLQDSSEQSEDRPKS